MAKGAELSRAELLAQLEKQKRDIIQKASVVITSIGEQFVVDRATSAEEAFRAHTVGLVSQTDYQRHRDNIEQYAQQQDEARARQRAEDLAKKQQEQQKRKKLLSISQADEEEEGEDDAAPVIKRAKLAKNPDADTSFLHDRQRDEEEKKLREKLTAEFEAEQERVKKEQIRVEFSYYDGSSHRRTVTVEKGATIVQFLEKARKELMFVVVVIGSIVSSHLSHEQWCIS